jgi:HNH endonuclease
MDRELEELIWDRAKSRCEYCQLAHDLDGFTHEIDHVIAQKHHGETVEVNLSLACFPCNNHKGPNVAGVDPMTKKVTKLFNPRRQKWHRHFRWDGPRLAGLTPVGRTTIDVLKINHPDRVLLRQSLIKEGVFPPASS